MNHPTRVILLLMVWMGSAALATASALDDRVAALAEKAAPTETDVASVLEAGAKENRSAEAIAAVQPWLNRHSLSSAKALFYAGQASERSGQSLAAVGYYQRLLQSEKPDAKRAGPAADATYRLLLNVLRADEAAYQFMRKEGDRIRSFGQARRYDRWFIDQAKSRRDLVAVAHRLNAVSRDKQSELSRFTRDFEWLCRELEEFRKEDPAVYQAAGELAGAPRTLLTVKARLTWVATVMPYNQKLDELRKANAPADAKLTDAPLAAAAQLLKASPDHGAIMVAKGWGVEYDHIHSGNCAKRFNIEGDRKLKQLLDHFSRMSPNRRDDLLGYRIAQGRVKFDPLAVRDLVLKYPDSFNRLDAADARLFDKEALTVEDAKKLAPHLARNPHGDAAVIRAIATSGSLEFGQIAEAMVKSELWRFTSVKAALDQAWRASTTQEAKMKPVLERFKKLDEQHKKLTEQVGKKATSQQRLAMFKRLESDLTSDAPSMMGALALWDRLFEHAPDADGVKMLTAVAGDLKGDREYLLRRAVGQVTFGSNRKLTWQAVPHYTHYRHNRPQIVKVAGPFTDAVRKQLEAEAKAGELSEWLFGLWLHNVDPNREQERAFLTKLIQTPAYSKLDRAYRVAATDREAFGQLAVVGDLAASDPRQVSGDLLALGKDAKPAEVEAALSATIKSAAAAPTPVTVIGLEPVVQLPEWNDGLRREVLSLFRELAPLGEYPGRQGYEPLVERLADEARTQKRWAELEPYLAGLWLAADAKDHHVHEAVPRLIGLAEAALAAGDNALALSIARSGLASKVGRALRDSGDERHIRWAGRLKQVEGKASIALGIIEIPVDERDPAYPIYKAQAEFAMGNTAAAWELYDNHPDQVEPILRRLTVPFCLWMLERDIAAGRSDRAETLIRALTIWSREASGTFTSQQEAELKIAYADAAFQEGNLQTAKAWYRRVADAKEYRGTPLQYKAVLRSVDVDRAAKDFGSAMAELDKLMRVRDDDLRMRLHFARAEVMFDQENYADAFDEVSMVLRRNPDHADALILLGKVQLEMRKLVDASEIELGVSRDQELIVPGETIKIDLNDPALNVSGVGADIEVEIWTKSGDRERVKLHQLGDDKTKFRAEVPTALAARRPGDKTLQVLGRDEIRYGYSKRFRAKMSDLPPDPEVVIGVASDATLSASAGAFPPRKGERRLNLEELGVSTAQQALGTRQVRPGNPIYVRVTDPDQSKTDEVDQIVVSVETSSGDVIPRLPVKETGKHTGEFEVEIPTRRAQALAYASESAPGRDPNMVISAEPYPGWSGEVGSKAPEQTFAIDLNDNVPLDAMSIHCDQANGGLTRFVVQTSMNGRDWVTRARYPDDPAPWSGRPQVSAFPTYGRNAMAVTELEDRLPPTDWRWKMDVVSARRDIAYNAYEVDGLPTFDKGLPSGGHPGYSVLVRYRAMFYQPEAAIRTFRLTGLPSVKDTSTVLLIDGEPAGPEADDPLTIRRELQAGLHEIEFWRHESRASLEKRKPQLLCDVVGKDELQPCPDDIFDPTQFPAGVRDAIAGPTKIAAVEDKPGQLDVAFGANTNGRLVRLVIVDHQGAAPAIRKINLTDRKGVQRLPVSEDYQQLRANGELEVVPGDRVIVRYEDDRVVTERRTIQQGQLSVAYNTATISASFLNYITTEEGRELVLEPIRRFKIDDSVGIVINDPDMDQTREPDEVAFTIQASSGHRVTLKALETGRHTGMFIGRVFPVSTEPERDSDIPIEPGDTLTARYRDEENLSPGIPTDRTVVIEHARFVEPVLAVYNVTSQPLPPKPADAEASKQADENERGPEIVEPRRAMHYNYAEPSSSEGQTHRAIIGGALRFDVLATHLAFAPSSSVTAYVQTEAGRAAFAASDPEPTDMPYDVRVFGTLKLTAEPSRSAETTAPAGYEIQSPATPSSSRPALDEGRFAFAIPIALGDAPTRSFADPEAETLRSSQIPDALAVRPGDRVHIGFAYFDADGKPQWLTATVELDSHVFLDVMNSRYREAVTTAFVGEKLHVRLIAPHMDLGPERDVAAVDLKSAGGTNVAYRLRETEAHSGVFKGLFKLSYADKVVDEELPPVELYGFPVKYGDRVTVSYPQSVPDAPPGITVSVNKGADGFIEPFSKRYGDDGVAIQTTFTLAECFFELAKHHRQMDQESLARREMGHAQKLLAEAIASHQDESMQAHAEYLLANLAQEYADLSKNDEAQQAMYQDALARFSKIPLEYPDTEFAPKAQFKKALVYEKLGEVDIAVEEYVKLAYKYPDHELIPSVMSRLGAHFQAQGLAHKTKAESLEKQEGDVEAQGEALKHRELATKEYLNAARVFKKLQERFPNDPLAGLAGLRSAQNYLRAGDYNEAVVGFQSVIDTEQYDGKTIRSRAMFWMGITYERLENLQEAYETYRRVTFDFPDSVWAKRSRGRLADPTFARIIEEEKLARERMLEALKEQRKNR